MKDRSTIRLDNDEVSMNLAIKLYRSSGDFLKLFDNMLKREVIESYSLILAHSKYDDLGEFIRKRKRRSDLLLEIDRDRNIYALVCSETEAGGGFYFCKRLSDALYREYEYEILASVLSIEKSILDIWDLIYDVSEPFVELLFNNKPVDIILNRYN